MSMSHTSKYWAHLVLALLVTVLFCYVIQRELQEYTRIWHLSTFDVGRSLLVSSPLRQLSPAEIRQYLHKTAGGVSSITSNRNYSSLRAKIRRRNVLLRKLELAVTTFILKANFQKGTTNQMYNRPERLWMKYLNQKDRPSFLLRKLPWLPFIGARVDAVQHLRLGIAQFNKEIEHEQKHPESFPQTNTSIVHFKQPVSMPLATLALKAQTPPSWTLKHATVPSDTIWSHVSISWWEQCVRTTVVYSLVTGLILGFAVPATFVGSLSQMRYLADAADRLKWIENLPDWLIAAIQGVLPPTLLAIMAALVPSLIRLVTNIQGLHSRQATENHVQIYYFAFLFIQGFLIISLSAGITTTVGELTTTIQALPIVLGQNLPKASNYFFSYLTMATVTSLVSTLIDLPQLLHLAVLSPLLDTTARQKWFRLETVGIRRWGALIPVITNIACISKFTPSHHNKANTENFPGLIFSVIAPLILIFSSLYFTAIWLLYAAFPPRLTGSDIGTGGLFFPTAMRQLFTGIYFMELCLAGLFFLVRDPDNKAVCITQGVIMAVATLLTALFHIYLYGPFSWVPFPGSLRSNVHTFLPEMRLGKEISEGSRVGWSDPRADQLQDEVLRPCRPIVWIPKDELGLAVDEIDQAKGPYESNLSCKSTALDEHGKIKVWGPPPDSQNI